MTNKITFLRGPERVRRRPAVIFGSDDIDGAMAALNILLDILAREGISRYCNQITVTQHLDNSIEIQDNGRGIFLGSPSSNDDTVWKELFCELYAKPLHKDGVTARCIFEGPSGKKGEYTDSLDMCSVQYASEYMDISVVRDGFKQMLHFEKGHNIGGLSRTFCNEPTETHIRFKPDPEVFSQIALPKQRISDALQTIAVQIPGIKIIFRHETPVGLEETEFCYPKGIVDFLQRQNNNIEPFCLYTAELTAEGRERYNKPRYTAGIKIAVRFAKDAGFVKCYHNLKELTCGGTHCDTAIERIGDYIGFVLGSKVKEEKLLKHLQIVIATNAEITSWVNSTQTAIENILIRDLTQDIIGDDFCHYVKQNAEFLSELFS